MSNNKPPMTVWLNEESCTAFDYGLRGMCEGQKDDVYRVGPYVHLHQFLEEVVSKARYAEENGLVGNAYIWALQELTNKVAMEGNQ